MPCDEQHAAALYAQASARGLREGRLRAGYLALRRGATLAAAHLFWQVAQTGSAEALYLLGAVLAAAPPSLQPELARCTGGTSAEDCLQHSAELGDSLAQFAFAQRLWGRGEVDAALPLLHAAARQRHGGALNALGVLAAEGQGGVMRDLNAAWACFTCAAAAGSRDGAANLAALQASL